MYNIDNLINEIKEKENNENKEYIKNLLFEVIEKIKYKNLIDSLLYSKNDYFMYSNLIKSEFKEIERFILYKVNYSKKIKGYLLENLNLYVEKINEDINNTTIN